jgi:hypothetical protein
MSDSGQSLKRSHEGRDRNQAPLKKSSTDDEKNDVSKDEIMKFLSSLDNFEPTVP